MNNTVTNTKRDWVIGITLLVILVITRSDHFGSSIKLPDASWALFWLSGALTIRWWWTAILMMTAAIVDYVAINHGVSSYCVTAAYPFLIPAYLSLWSMGRWASQSLDIEWRSLLRVIVSVLNGVTLAFIISNYSFYTFSGKFAALTPLQYTQATMQYWPVYLLHTTIYIAIGLLVRFVIRASHSALAQTRA